MLQDVQAHRPTEIDAICGAVYREGERRGIAAPLNQAMTVLVEGINPARPQ
jgi:2-dehydropantoate 2-reductase